MPLTHFLAQGKERTDNFSFSFFFNKSESEREEKPLRIGQCATATLHC